MEDTGCEDKNRVKIECIWDASSLSTAGQELNVYTCCITSEHAPGRADHERSNLILTKLVWSSNQTL